MLLGILISYIIHKLFAHESQFEKDMNELIKEEKEILHKQSFKDYFRKA